MEPWKIKFFRDMDLMKVFESVVDSPKSALQISKECNIPRSTVYKKLRILQDRNLLKTKRILQNGAGIKIYKKDSSDMELNE